MYMTLLSQVNCLDSVANLARLVHHYKCGVARDRGRNREGEKRMKQESVREILARIDKKQQGETAAAPDKISLLPNKIQSCFSKGARGVQAEAEAGGQGHLGSETVGVEPMARLDRASENARAKLSQQLQLGWESDCTETAESCQAVRGPRTGKSGSVTRLAGKFLTGETTDI